MGAFLFAIIMSSHSPAHNSPEEKDRPCVAVLFFSDQSRLYAMPVIRCTK